MAWAMRGVIEGFYGPPWSWDARVEVARHCAERGMTHYVYAPKDDPKHRERWREPYDEAALDGFRRLAAEGGLRVGFGISPGLSMDYGSDDDRHALLAKIDQVVGTGVDLVCLALDDIPNRPGLGAEHGALTAWLHGRLAGRAGLVLVPTEYVGDRSTAHLDELAALVPPDVPIAWTGMAVVNDTVTAAEAARRAEALGGRPPLLWDNYPVNDGIMRDRLFMGPLWGRDPGLADVCCGYLANPMVQPRCSLLPLASVAAFLRGEDALGAWADEAESAGTRVFAEACDGAVPRALVHALAEEGEAPGWADSAAPLARWLESAAACSAPGLEEEAGRWLDQVHREAEVALAALALYQSTRPIAALDAEGRGRAAPPSDLQVLLGALSLAERWTAVRRTDVSVMGVRAALRPMIGQRDDGAWRILPGMLQEDESAVDALVRLALGQAAAMASPAPLWVGADGAAVEVADDGSFTVPPGATVLVRSGQAVLRCRTPSSPPLSDRRLP